MLQPTCTLLTVDAPEASGRFYAALLGRAPVEAGPTFVLFAFEGGLRLGLWSRHAVAPAATAAGGAEIAVTVADDAALEATHAAWVERGLPILQAPTEMGFRSHRRGPRSREAPAAGLPAALTACPFSSASGPGAAFRGTGGRLSWRRPTV